MLVVVETILNSCSRLNNEFYVQPVPKYNRIGLLACFGLSRHKERKGLVLQTLAIPLTQLPKIMFFKFL